MPTDPQSPPERIHRPVTPATGPPTQLPEEWDDEAAWEAALEAAYESIDLDYSDGNLTTREVDGRNYYYLQWRDGHLIKLQYVAPLVPPEE